MEHAQAVALIRGGVDALRGGVWADLGAGTGVFTRALSELLGPEGTVYAVERDARALTQLKARLPSGAAIIPYRADFTKARFAYPSSLNGLLLANSLHFVARQEFFLRRTLTYLKPRGTLLLVEYDVEQRSPWNPFPVPPRRFQSLAAALGLSPVLELSRRPSAFGGRDLYAAAATKDR